MREGGRGSVMEGRNKTDTVQFKLLRYFLQRMRSGKTTSITKHVSMKAIDNVAIGMSVAG